MKTLCLFRHGEAEVSATIREDKNRKLTEQGKQVVKEKTKRFPTSFIQEPIKILCSTSMRTQETAVIFRENLALNDTTFSLEEKIFKNDINLLQQRVAQVSETFNSIVLIGHNPSIEELARTLTPKIYSGFQTATIAIIQFSQNTWSEAIESTGELVFFDP